MNHRFCIVSVFIFIINTFVALTSFASPDRTTYQAKIVKPDGYPLEASSVNFKFTILDPAGTCILYSETYSTVNMSGSGGLTSFALGSGVKTYPASATTFRQVFDNATVSLSCDAGGPGIYNPTPTDNRKIVMQFNDGNGWQTLPSMAINAVPYAMYAGKAEDSILLNGKADTAFLQKVNDIPTCTSGKMLYFNNASFSCIDVPAVGTSINSVSVSGSALSIAGTVSDPVVTMSAATVSNDGYLTSLDYAEFKAKLSASSTQISNTLGYAPVSSSAVATQILSSNLSGDVSGTITSNFIQTVGGKTASQISTSVDDTLAATSSNTVSTIVKRNSSGNVTFNDVYANSTKLNYVDIYKPSSNFNIQLQASTSLSANYTLTLPTSSGATGQVLSTDGGGTLSWINPSTGSVVSVSAAAPLASTGGATPTISITQSSSSTDGYLSSTDWNTFNNKQVATSVAIIATLGYTPANATSATQWTTNGSNIYYNTGNISVGVVNPSAKLELASGTASVAPLKFSSGTLLTSVQSGTMEYDGFNFYLTDSTNIRRSIATGSNANTIDNVSNINSSGNITMTPVGSVIVSSTTASMNSNTGALVVKGGLGVAGNINTAGNLNVSGSSVIDGALKLSSMTSGSVLFAGANGTVTQDNNSFYWDSANKRLGIGANSPAQTLSVSGTSYFSGNVGVGIAIPTAKLHVRGSSDSIANFETTNLTGATGNVVNISGGMDNLGSDPTLLNLYTGTAGAPRGKLFKAANSNYSFELNNAPEADGYSFNKIFVGGYQNWLPNTTAYGETALQAIGVSSTSWFDGNTPVAGNAVNINITGWGGSTPSYRNVFGVPVKIRAANPSATTTAFYADVADAANNWAFYAASGNSYFSGNVGIGTIMPSEKLSVNGRGIFGPNSTWGQSLIVGIDTSLLASGVASATIGATNGNIHIEPKDGFSTYINHYASGTNNIIMQTGNSKGNVGIGTTVPTASLHINDRGTSDDNQEKLKIGIGIVSQSTVNIISNDSANSLAVYDDNNLTTPRFLVQRTGNVGVGTANPGQKLTVSGTIESTSGGVKYPDGTTQTTAYTGSSNIATIVRQTDNAAPVTKTQVIKRYVIEATKAQVQNTVPINHTLLTEMCRRKDGCSVTLGMRSWDSAGQPGNVASRGPYQFYMSETSNWWRLSNTDSAGLDDNAAVNHVLQAWDCYFTDGSYTSGTGTDPGLGFGLLNWNATYTDANMVCVLTIEGFVDSP